MIGRLVSILLSSAPLGVGWAGLSHTGFAGCAVCNNSTCWRMYSHHRFVYYDSFSADGSKVPCCNKISIIMSNFWQMEVKNLEERAVFSALAQWYWWVSQEIQSLCRSLELHLNSPNNWIIFKWHYKHFICARY